MDTSFEEHGANPEWMLVKRDLADVFHRLAVAYEEGKQFADAIRIYTRELSLRETAQTRGAEDVVHCLHCLAELYEGIGEQLEAERQRFRAMLLTKQFHLNQTITDCSCHHKPSPAIPFAQEPKKRSS